jgi:hypothetical protein
MSQSKNQPGENLSSLKEELIKSLFDKLLLGILSAILILIIEGKFEKAQERRAEISSISQVEKEIVLIQRQHLIDTMQEYFRIVEKEGAKVKGLSAEQQIMIDNISIESKVIFATVVAVSPEVSDSTEALTQLIHDVNVSLQNQEVVSPDKKEELYAKFEKTISDFTEAAIVSFDNVENQILKF